MMCRSHGPQLDGHLGISLNDTQEIALPHKGDVIKLEVSASVSLGVPEMPFLKLSSAYIFAH